MTTAELIDRIKTAGGVLELDGEHIDFQLPEDASHLLDLLRERKPEVIDILKARGGRVATFPRCPRCTSTFLYRENNIGAFECQTCGLAGIPEELARRVQ